MSSLKILRFVIFIALLTCMNQFSFGQMYTVQKYQHNYTNLLSGTVISTSVWDTTVFSIPIGFDFQFYDKNFTTLYIRNGTAYLSQDPTLNTYGDTIYVIDVFGANLIDRGWTSNNVQSPISYETSGTTGQRIFKLQFKNAGSGDELDSLGTTDDYIDFQLWLHEQGWLVEVHYGPRSLRPVSFKGLYGPRLGVGKVYIDPIDSIYFPVRGTFVSGPYFLPRLQENWLTSSFIGIPENGTVYQFGFDRDIILNNVSLELINGFEDPETYLVDGTFSEEFGAALGHNIYRDTEFAERYTLRDSAIVKGFVSQNYGFSTSNDSASFSIYSMAPDSLPGELITYQKVAYNCLNLEGELNYVELDSPVVLKGTYFITFGLAPYETVGADIIGLYTTWTLNDESNLLNYGRTAVKWADGNWYDVYTTKMFSERFGVDSAYDLRHFSIAPMVNYNWKNTSPLSQHINCMTSTNNTQIPFNEDLIINSCYPNPAENSFNVSFHLRQIYPVELSVYDLLGRMVFHKYKSNVVKGWYHNTINSTGWENGIYAVVVSNGKVNKSASIIIQH